MMRKTPYFMNKYTSKQRGTGRYQIAYSIAGQRLIVASQSTVRQARFSILAAGRLRKKQHGSRSTLLRRATSVAFRALYWPDNAR